MIHPHETDIGRRVKFINGDKDQWVIHSINNGFVDLIQGNGLMKTTVSVSELEWEKGFDKVFVHCNFCGNTFYYGQLNPIARNTPSHCQWCRKPFTFTYDRVIGYGKSELEKKIIKELM